jgi:hypothetical protein
VGVRLGWIFLLGILCLADFGLYLVFASRHRKSCKVDKRTTSKKEGSIDNKTCHE